MKGNPRCFGRIKRYYPEVLTLERTDNGVYIRYNGKDSPCAKCGKKKACMAVVFKEEIEEILEKGGKQ